MAQDIAQQIRDAFLAGSRDTLVERMGITILEIAFRQPRPITIPPARPRPEKPTHRARQPTQRPPSMPPTSGEAG